MSAFGHAGTAFITIFPAELPDKTMIATVVLTTRYRRPLLVWLGASAGFAVHVVVAVTTGRLLALLPSIAVDVAAAVLFAAGAVILWRAAPEGSAEPRGETAVTVTKRRPIVVASATVILVAEWGDLTQLATAGLAARTADPLFVGIGALAALWAVAALAVTGGAALTRVLPVHLLRRIAAGVFAVLAVFTIVEAVRGG
jgi:putative Ca2+/H+ antiporter (TMEM165/GDT1 family)